ncbi:maleylpyruvate isomerase N-terminal domain-containing protein [Amycolatopsis sp. H20-H5]|uniref:maleylpyruvate isomerase N-terminal domain-containing protein n=1 Tax=Amycolatopsis sp. H20-H5 TaxID=3046309 RepID=UPI002DB98F7B|nr:maleylpyruvate isomerase N-terminal domain-containing protein [Amycolatopsis sp. H20-H5]MEC3979864.1 maleylpyruvate isomerase N-terminal domain-containing protein [Amycolatopsis sp. H20-H5]
MDEVYRGRLAALERTWQVWAETGRSLTEDQWTAESRCVGWDVAALYTHHSLFPLTLSAPPGSSAEPDGEPVTAVEALRSFNAPEGLAHTMADAVETRAVDEAAQHTRQELADVYGVHGPRAVERLRGIDAARRMRWGSTGLVVTVAEGSRMVLMEATVHLLDVQRALRLPPDVPPAALRDTALLLAELAPPVDLIEAATGRSQRSPLPVLR